MLHAALPIILVLIFYHRAFSYYITHTELAAAILVYSIEFES